MKKISPIKSLLNIFSKSSKKFAVLVMAAAALLTVLTAVVLITYIKKDNQTDTISTVCEAGDPKGILQQGADAIIQKKQKNLGQIVDKIKQISDYSMDADCLNVITTYYVNEGNTSEAAAVFSQLESVYDSEKGFSNVYGGRLLTIDELRDSIEFLKGQANEAERNAFYGPVVEE